MALAVSTSSTAAAVVFFLMLSLLSKTTRAWSTSSTRSPLLLRVARTSSSSSSWATTTTTTTSSSWSSSSRLYSTSSPENSVAATTETATTPAVPEIKIPRRFVPFPFEYHEILTLRVDALTNLGMGICRTPVEQERTEKVTADDGTVTEVTSTSTSDWVIFVPNTIPGELVQLRVYRNYKTYSDADLLDVLEKSPHRVDDPPCPLAQLCGGCQYQHMAIDAQREWKTLQVLDGLVRIGGFDEGTTSSVLHPTVGTDEIWHYRSKITPHYEAPKKVGDASWEIGSIGFKEKNSRRLVDVPQCLIATEAINSELTSVRDAKRLEANEGKLKRPKKGATLLLRDANEGVVTDHNQYVTTSVAVPEGTNGNESNTLDFRFLAGNFFQNNPYMLPVMVEYVVAAAVKGSNTHDKMTHLIDCYCGSGLFCLSSASAFEQCVGIEVNKLAVEEATSNAALNGIDNCAFVAASAEAIFESTTPPNDDTVDEYDDKSLVQDFPRDTTVVVCDPPRKGCSEEFLEQLYRFGPQRVVYMSCDPSTQARDAKGIVEAGYTITSVQPFDLFPQTRHIECLVIFERTD